ncbi:MAG TPA: VOC family protein [Jiangellaceae bacterium]
MDDDLAVARWRAMRMDADDHGRLAGFWAATLGLSPADADDGAIVLLGDSDAQQIVIDHVPEPKSVKHRVHVDVDVGDIDGVRMLGATIVRAPDDEIHWWVMADPEGGEFCAFVREGRPSLPGRLYEVVVDCVDPHAQARWWGEVFGLVPEGEPHEHVAALEGGDRLPFDYLCFVPVPEPRTAPNRIRWDITTTDVATLVGYGATILSRATDDQPWFAMADPEGNEFRAFTP